ncbi:methyltransferase domain-containing protein [Chloroflexota bacterium]
MKSDDISGAVPPLIIHNQDILICPSCNGGLDVTSDRRMIRCFKCNQSFGCEAGIPLLFYPNEWDSRTDVTETIKSFYEENPFPGYEDIDSDQSLRQKAEKGILARLLDEQIPHGARILEVGCGTGQLSNFLGMTWGRTVFATDICLNSLRLGQNFKQKNGIDNVAFFQMNLFKPVFRPESFDLVICNGVLHHTSDPFLGFKSLTKLVKKGGFIIVGLYNTYGRIPTDARRLIFKLSGNRFKSLHTCLRDENLTSAIKHIWLMDQYNNPHESKHTIGEVLSWFDHSEVEFFNSIPKATAFASFYLNEELFESNPRGTKLDHFCVQLGMLLSGGREGGVFIMIGRKRA